VGAEGQIHSFNTTHWSVVLAANNGSDEARQALAALCHTYWRPVFAFIQRRGHSVQDAQDLTQDFFLHVLDGSLLQRADPARGRFRSLLLKSLQHFLIDAHTKRTARKRGGDFAFVSWDDWAAEAPSQMMIPAEAIENWPAERLFDVRWATTVVEQAMRSLREECESRDRRALFDLVSPFLAAERDELSYHDLAERLGTAPATTRSIVHRMRGRYREHLRAAVAQTVENPDEVDEEIRSLCSILALQEA
jgi:RNA polymerase sigma-70 factor (ECF subfamily)